METTPDAQSRRSWKPRDRRHLGATLSVSPLCIGAVADPGTIVEAFEAGVNFFFVTADMHWPMYEPTRRGLEWLFEKGVRDDVVVAGVSYQTQPDFCHVPFKELINCVRGLARLEMTVIGGSYASDFLPRRMEYERHRRIAGAWPYVSGVRATGCSFHDRRCAAWAIEEAQVDLAYIRYNAAHPGAEDDLFPRVSARRETLLFNFQSTHGHVTDARLAELGVGEDKWRPRIVDHYRFVMSHPRVDGILCSPTTPVELREMLDAVVEGELQAEELAYMKRLCMLDSGEIQIDREAEASR